MGRIRESVTQVIATGETVSAGLTISSHAAVLAIHAPAVLPETITVQVAPRVGAVWRILMSNGDPVTVSVGAAMLITDIGFRQIRLVAGSAVAEPRVFDIVETMGGRG